MGGGNPALFFKGGTMSVAVYNHFQQNFGKADTVKTEQVSNTGEVRQVVCTIPSFSGDSITATVTVVDANGAQLFTSGALNPSSKTVFWPYSTNMPFCVDDGTGYVCNIVVTLTGAPANSGGTVNADVKVDLFIKC
jgi:hypothetical protein